MGKLYSFDQSKRSEKKYNELSKDIPSKAEALYQQAVEAGQNREYEKAIKLLKKALTIAPDWPYVTYGLAFCSLLKGDDDTALANYELTNKLAPNGIFESEIALHTLRKEKSGEFPKGLYMVYLTIGSTNDFNKKLFVAKQLTEKHPNFASAWKKLADLLEDKEERFEAINAGLECDSDLETRGALLINKAAVLASGNYSEKHKEEAINILLGIISDDRFSPEIKTLAKISLTPMTN